MTRRCGRTRRTAFTLIELLAVIVLLGIVAGLAIPRLSAVSETVRVDHTLSMWRTLDARARSLALRRTDRVELRLIGDSLQLWCGDELIARRLFPDALAIELRVTEAPTTAIVFNRTGSSPAYTVTVRGQETASEGKQILAQTTCNGRTGWFSTEDIHG